MTRSVATALFAGGPFAAAVVAAALGYFGTSGALAGLQIGIWLAMWRHPQGFQ